MTTDLLDSKLHKYACEGKKSKLKAVLKNGKLNASFIHSLTYLTLNLFPHLNIRLHKHRLVGRGRTHGAVLRLLESTQRLR